MEHYLRDDEIEKALEEIFGIPDDGSEDGNESDEAEEFNVNNIQRVLEDNSSSTSSPAPEQSEYTLRNRPEPEPSSSHSTSAGRSDYSHQDESLSIESTQQIPELLEEEPSDESECEDESWGKNMWDSRPDPEFDEVTVQPKYLMNRKARPVAHFEKFFNDDGFDLIITQTNLYAEQERIKNLSPVDKAEIRAFLGIFIIMGYHILPQIDLYWSTDPGFRVNEVADVTTVKRFKKILQALHLNNNREQPERGSPDFDKLYKLRPLISLLNDAFQNNATNSSSQSIDESMILFKGRSSLKQYMPLKPIKRGYKVWCCCDSSTGYLYNFEIYTGKTGQGTE
ncbi:piggyBac transposable element-derived protein 4-like [Pararge aegeria]|uniref:piggyBac transposable element-derived protein 4-like n=1 Tax=Pararge aegeria TaxID=116150 RepID=UPI0019D172E1|nr:piggyBac transposable element-derived protein 4-like [Pararge aegeria]XP_039764258.1 piggyBac transposable element-derived protein 4-like [Pararge aegeria]